MFEVSVQRTFSSAHALRNYRGKCENVHGHNYRVEVTVQGEALDEAGLLLDFVEIKRCMAEVIDYLDHRHLNDLPPFTELNPSAENIAKYFYDRIADSLRAPGQATIACVKIWETDTSYALYRP